MPPLPQSQPTSDPETEVVDALLRWASREGRVFPWRDWDDGYRVLVLEILLRQTRADSIAPFVTEFLAAYPDATSLAAAGERELAGVLHPLGFNSQRAGQLKALGAALVQVGAVPMDMDELMKLPGVGRYTASMVAAIVGRQPVSAVDTNVARVICRVFGLTPSHAESRKSTNVWDQAGRLVAAATPVPAPRITWAMVDLAAAVCTPRDPRCAGCPLLGLCAYADRTTGERTAEGGRARDQKRGKRA